MSRWLERIRNWIRRAEPEEAVFAGPPERRPPKRGRPEREPPDTIEDDGFVPPEPGPVTDVLDLHGFFPEQVSEVLDEYLRVSLEAGRLEVRIVHGKGRSVLKARVREFLEGDDRVAGFRDAPPERGGWGATIVHLHASEPEP